MIIFSVSLYLLKFMCAFWNYLIKNPDIITWFLVILGWVIVHFFSKKRDLKNKQREMKVSYLVDTYRLLKSSHVSKNQADFIRAIDDIQLFGSKKTLISLRENLDWYIKDDTDQQHLKKILNALRDDLQGELEIEQTNDDFVFLSTNLGKITKVGDKDFNPDTH